MNAVATAVMFVGGAVLYAVAGVFVGRAEGHNDVLVPLFLTAGVMYAVLLAFMVVAEWEFHVAAHENAAEEAALLVPLYRQSTVMAEEKGREMRQVIRNYAEDVVKGWRASRRAAGTRRRART